MGSFVVKPLVTAAGSHTFWQGLAVARPGAAAGRSHVIGAALPPARVWCLVR
jgi:hypothetical protein